MVKRHANLRFSHYTQAELVLVAANIVNTMAANADIFPTPPVLLADVTKLINAYSAVLGKEEYAGKTGDIRAARRAVEVALKQLGQYVNSVADGDEAILEKSGFPLSKVPSPHGDIPAPDTVGAELNADGSFTLWASIVDKSYSGVLFAYTEVSNPELDPYRWTLHYAPVPEVVIGDGLVRGKEYKFAVAFLGSSEKLNWKTMGETLFASYVRHHG